MESGSSAAHGPTVDRPWDHQAIGRPIDFVREEAIHVPDSRGVLRRSKHPSGVLSTDAAAEPIVVTGGITLKFGQFFALTASKSRCGRSHGHRGPQPLCDVTGPQAATLGM